MSFFTDLQKEGARTGGLSEKVALEPGQYGDKGRPGLEIIQYIDNPRASKLLPSGVFRHSLLVTAVAASKESRYEKTNGKDHGDDPFGGESIPNGTAFMKIDLREEWLQDESIALAMGDNWVEKAVASGVPRDNFDEAVAHFRQQATEQCINAHTPADQMEEAVDKQYKNIMTQIRINVGLVFRLQDWAGRDWDARMDLHKLAGTRFGGRVTKSDIPNKDGEYGSEVASVYEKGK